MTVQPLNSVPINRQQPYGHCQQVKPVNMVSKEALGGSQKDRSSIDMIIGLYADAKVHKMYNSFEAAW